MVPSACLQQQQQRRPLPVVRKKGSEYVSAAVKPAGTESQAEAAQARLEVDELDKFEQRHLR